MFIKDFKIVYSTKYFIKPPTQEKFSAFHSNIHNIYEEDVERSFTFEELWEGQFSKYFNDSLIVFHNASMDLSILKNLFKHYSITNFNIDYIDTMQLAEKSGNPKKLIELAEKFGIEIENHHNPISDAKACALIYNELIDIYPKHKELIKNLNNKSADSLAERYFNNYSTEAINIENSNYIQIYTIPFLELDKLEIENKNIVITGKFELERDYIENFILKNGGVIKPAITNKIDFVIVGEEYGWSKIQKIHELNSTKKMKIKILSEIGLQFLIKKLGT